MSPAVFIAGLFYLLDGLVEKGVLNYFLRTDTANCRLMQENYFPPERLLELSLGSVVQVIVEGTDVHFSVRLVGVDKGHHVIISMPTEQCLPPEARGKQLFDESTVFEMKTMHDGSVMAFEAQPIVVYKKRLLICTFPEMVETRRLRRHTRFPCALSCDIHYEKSTTYGVISNISSGGCQLSVQKDNDYSIIEQAFQDDWELNLEVFIPPSEEPVLLAGKVKSAECLLDGSCKVGIAFQTNYESVRQYLESLQLDSVAPFFN